MNKFYQDINALSADVYRKCAYYGTDATHNIEYHCEAFPWTKKYETKRRVKRIRYLTADSSFVDTMRAQNPTTELGTADFIFDAIEATVKALDFDYDDDLAPAE